MKISAPERQMSERCPDSKASLSNPAQAMSPIGTRHGILRWVPNPEQNDADQKAIPYVDTFRTFLLPWYMYSVFRTGMIGHEVMDPSGTSGDSGLVVLARTNA